MPACSRLDRSDAGTVLSFASDTSPVSSGRITFRGGWRTALGFAVGVALTLAVWVPIDDVVAAAPAWVELLSEVTKFWVLAGVTLAALRVDGVAPESLGLSRRHLLAALVAVAGIWLGLNGLGLALAALAGHGWGVDALTTPVDPRWTSLPAPWVVTVSLQFLVVGLVEEFALRGYFQTKLIALLGDSDRRRIALGIAAASVLFGLLHAPGAILAGASPAGVLGVIASRTVTGLAFGVLYELTHNVYFVALLHGLGNTWPLLVDPWAWSGPALAAFGVGVFVCYVGVALGYRRWAIDAGPTPIPRRSAVAGSPR